MFHFRAGCYWGRLEAISVIMYDDESNTAALPASSEEGQSITDGVDIVPFPQSEAISYVPVAGLL